MCHEPRPTPVIEEQLRASDIITNSSQRLNIIPCRTQEKHSNSTVISYDRQSQLASNHHETISSEFEKKARIYNDVIDSEPLVIHGAEAASEGPSSSSANKNNEINKKWKCQHCTYMNWPKSVKCSICATNKSHRLGECQRRISSEDESIESPMGSHNLDPTQKKHRLANDKGSQPSSPQPGACGRHSTSSNLASRCNDGHCSRAIGRQKKSSSEENLNNAMNANAEGGTRGRHYSHDSNQIGFLKDFGIDNIAKKRDIENQRAWKKSRKNLNLLFLKACVGK